MVEIASQPLCFLSRNSERVEVLLTFEIILTELIKKNIGVGLVLIVIDSGNNNLNKISSI